MNAKRVERARLRPRGSREVIAPAIEARGVAVRPIEECGP